MTLKPHPHWRLLSPFPVTVVDENGDCSRQCGRGFRE